MKKLLLLFFFLCYTAIAIAQWLPEVRLTNAAGYSYLSYTRNIACYSNFIHVVWYDNRDGNYEIYYKHSTDRGVTWGPDIRLTNNSQSSMFPSLALSGLNVHIAWYDDKDGNFEIYYKHSTDGGLTWSNDIRLTNTADRSRLPSLVVNNSNLYLVWEENESYTDIYFKYSTNGGITWSTGVVLDNGASSSTCPNISLSGTAIHVVWEDSRNGYATEIYYKHSNDAGISWSSDTRLTNSTAWSIYPFISSLSSDIHVTFQESNVISYIHSIDGGLTWEPIIILSNIAYDSWHPAISLSGYLVHLVWYSYIGNIRKVFYRRSTDKGVNWAPSTILTSDSTASSILPSITVLDSMINVVWSDYRDGNLEIYYKCNLNGNVVNAKKSNWFFPDKFSLSQNYPNPFNPVTKIKFDIPPSKGVRGMITKLIIYDILGQEIATLVNEQLTPGKYEVQWDGFNYPSGVYFYRLVTEGFTETKRMVLLK